MRMDIQKYLSQIKLPKKDSHKGQNGKLLIIGGSELFHAASAWSLEIASKIVDMVFYSSVIENNQLIQEAKRNFWNGVVVPRGEVESYIGEADVVLIGPGMERSDVVVPLTSSIDWEHDTYIITNYLLEKYPNKKWVVDAGALQMIEQSLLNAQMIITPHVQEFSRVFGEAGNQQTAEKMSREHNNVTIVLKGIEDVVTNGTQTEIVTGGNEGMTKGGTGDVLAGLIASLYCMNDAFTASVAGSYVNKKAGDELFESVGPFFNSTDLVQQLPRTMKNMFSK